MTAGTAAALPPVLPGLDPGWSRLVSARDGDGVVRSWHVLDNGATPTVATMLCVHGNPTWSYLWRRHLAEAPAGWRVIAVDQLGMGFSQRTGKLRTMAQRIDDLGVVMGALGVDGPIVTVGHDWGGPISLGFALAHRERLLGVVLANTGVHQPADSPIPALIRLARTPALRHAVCAATPVFVRVAGLLSRPALDPAVRAALAAPYRGVARRQAVSDFVADIPLEPEHPSSATLDGVAAGLPELAETPVLLLWGPRDPVFSDRYLRDLLTRVPHADVQRYENASHLVTEDAPRTALDTWAWIADRTATLAAGVADPPPADPAPGAPVLGIAEPGAPAPGERPVWAGLSGRAGDPAAAVVEMGGRTISFDLLERRVRELAAGFAAHGVRAGDRVAMLVPPGADLTAAVYACWRIGAVIVIADAGLGPVRLAGALRGTHPDHVIGIPRGLALAAALGVPGRRIVAGRVPARVARSLRATRLVDLARMGGVDEPAGAGGVDEPAGAGGVDEPAGAGGSRALPPGPAADAECAVVFTSGATGPAKGVVYRHRQVQAQIAMLRAAFAITGDDRLVAAFPPFALYGPALGIASAAPDSPAPGRLTAVALADAAAAVDATVVFASPAALRNVVATAAAVTDAHRPALARVRLIVSAGAPVPSALLHALREVLPGATAHTPYGMTEALPVTDITLDEIDRSGVGEGVCVGRPLPGVAVAVSPLSPDGAADGALTDAPGVTGEVCVAAAHVKDHYDQLWATEHAASRDPGHHRTGDVGHLDEQGRLWIEGRLPHVITTAGGPLTPVGIEQRVQAVAGVTAAAAVGVGPVGVQQVTVVLGEPGRSPVLAPAPLAAAVRAAAGTGVAAVLLTDALPVDIRHASKIDRARVAHWAGEVLAGRRAGRRP